VNGTNMQHFIISSTMPARKDHSNERLELL